MRLDQQAQVWRRGETGRDRLNVPTPTFAPLPGTVDVNVQRTEATEVVGPVGTMVVADLLIYADPAPPYSPGDILLVGDAEIVIVTVDPDAARRGRHSEARGRSSASSTLS